MFGEEAFKKPLIDCQLDIGDSETSDKKLTAGMLVTEGDDANEDGDGDDGGECDGDIFDAEGW